MLFTALALSGCGKTRQQVGVIRVWCHQGQESENRVMRQLAEKFNQAHADEGLRVELEFFPDYQYSEKISTAAAAGDLPDALDMDGPTVAQLVEAGLLQPIDPWVPAEEKQDFLDTIIRQGTIDNTLYALGSFDSALVLYYDRDMLAAAAVQPPPEHAAWTWDEFMAACRKLQQNGTDPLAMHMNESADEWYTYAFSPVIWSAGGHLIEGRQAEGVLNAPENVQALEKWQQVFNRDFASKNPVDPDPFGNGKTAMDWTGHWMARSHGEKKKDRLGVMPLPRLGKHPVTGCGSWCWGITSTAQDPEQAAKWIQWVTAGQTGIQPIVQANGAIPARKSVMASMPSFRETPYKEFQYGLEHWGRPRPRTPYYSVLTQHFAAALRDIANGANVQQRLDQAAEQIQQVIDRSGS
jgi:multiple sugar transport system substrate-binding protein